MRFISGWFSLRILAVICPVIGGLKLCLWSFLAVSQPRSGWLIFLSSETGTAQGQAGGNRAMTCCLLQVDIRTSGGEVVGSCSLWPEGWRNTLRYVSPGCQGLHRWKWTSDVPAVSVFWPFNSYFMFFLVLRLNNKGWHGKVYSFDQWSEPAISYTPINHAASYQS